MSDREQLLYELEKTPDILIKEILNFLLFVRTKTVLKTEQKYNQNSNTEEIKLPSFLNFVDQINSDYPEENESLPTDFAQNLDHYLYGLPKE
jgi:ubiquitin C-terminal hydrolase